MSSTPVLNRTNEDVDSDWVEVVPPRSAMSRPLGGDVVAAIGRLCVDIAGAKNSQLMLNESEEVRPMDDLDHEFSTYAASRWDS